MTDNADRAPGFVAAASVDESYAEAAAREVLTAPESRVDGVVGSAALLLACLGEFGESDRLVRHWRSTEGTIERLVPDPITARAWAMVFHAHGSRPDWAQTLVPLDLDEEEQAHRSQLTRPGSLRAWAAEAEDRARNGDAAGTREALRGWAEHARGSPDPDVATLGACRHVAPFLVEGALPVPSGWAAEYAGLLIAALRERYPPSNTPGDWHDLIGEIMRLRGTPADVPPPATPTNVADVERRLNHPLPNEVREFLGTCDGLPADVVFPRLLGTAEIEATDQGIRLSEPATVFLHSGTGEVIESDPLFGDTVHSGVRSLLEEHHRLLQATM